MPPRENKSRLITEARIQEIVKQEVKTQIRKSLTQQLADILQTENPIYIANPGLPSAAIGLLDEGVNEVKLNIAGGSDGEILAKDSIAPGGFDWKAVTTIGAAPDSAQYLTLALDATLTSERRFVPGAVLTATDGGAGGDYTLEVDDSKPAVSVPVGTDQIAFYDSGLAAMRKTDIQDLANLALPASIGAAPDDASFIVVTLDPDLSAERNLAVGDGMAFTDSGPNGPFTLRTRIGDGLEFDSATMEVLFNRDSESNNVSGLRFLANADASGMGVAINPDDGIAHGFNGTRVDPDNATEDTSPDLSADFVLTHDDSASAPDDTKKVKLINILNQVAHAILATSGAQCNVSNGVTAYSPIAGGANLNLSDSEIEILSAGTIKNLSVYVSANGSTSAGNTVTVLKNGAAQSLAVSYGAGTTGRLRDTSNSFTVAAQDKLAIRVVHNGSFGDTSFDVENWSFEFYPA